MRTGVCDGQMGGLTELSALLAAQTFVECQPKLLKHSNRPLLNISHRENNYIHIFVKMQRQKNDCTNSYKPHFVNSQRSLLLKWLPEFKISVDHLPT